MELAKAKDMRRIRKHELEEYTEKLKRARALHTDNGEQLRQIREQML